MNYLKKSALHISFLFLLLITATSIFSAATPIEFFGARAFGNGGSVYYGIEDGDFNGDGKTDVLTSSYSNILVFYGDSNGSFSMPPVTPFSANGGNIFLVGGDFNNDGRTDIVYTERNPTNNQPSIVVMYGNVDKTFSPPIYSSLELMPSSSVPVDFDNDGKLDLLGKVATPGDNSIVFYKGSGSGTFTIKGQLKTTYDARDISTGDFNNDGLPDVSYSDFPDLKVSQNMGNGTFGAPIKLGTVTYGFNSNEIADVNNDGKDDIVAVQSRSFDPKVMVWLGNNNFTFTQLPDFVIRSMDDIFLQKIADIDNDQNQDLVFSSKNRIIISNSIGNGKFADEQSYIDGGGSLFVKDINSDGELDIVAGQSVEFAVQGSGSFSVLINLQDGFFKSAPALPTGDETKDIAIADFDADGINDFVVVNQGGGGAAGDVIVVSQTIESGLTGNNLSKFTQAKTAKRMELMGDAGIDPFAVLTGDFNQDNKIDIVAVGHAPSPFTQNALILLNSGNSDFSPSLFQIGAHDISSIASADLNSDGKLDLITTSYPTGVSVSFGNGNGTFAAPVNYFANIPSSQVTIGDFNNDLKVDIAVVNKTINKIGILINNGNGVFTNNVNLSIDGDPNEVAIAEMNGDGNLDLVVSKGNGVSVLMGIGNGIFNNEVSYSITPVSASGLAVTDFNGDEKPDVALMGGTNTISILLNNGVGGLGNETLWGGGAVLSALVAGDLNKDNKNDLITGFSTSSEGYVKILFNITGERPISRKVLLDFDGDGKTDISIFRPSLGEWWYLKSSTGGNDAFQFGSSTDKIVPADYTGDGKADVAFFRPSSGEWFVLRSEDNSFYSFPFGTNGDIPFPADFDGDGRADAAVFRPSTNAWYIQRSSGGVTIQTFGSSGDMPVVADYDGDGKADIAIYRPSKGEWWILKSSGGTIAFQFGNSSDKPVQGDFTGDGKADVAFYRPSSGEWFVLRSENSSFYSYPFGTNGDIPSPGDYDGDGKFDATVFRPSNNTWFIQRSTSGTLIQTFGQAGDKPVPNAFVP